MSEIVTMMVVSIITAIMSPIVLFFVVDHFMKPFRPIGDIVGSIDLQSGRKTKQAFNAIIKMGETAGWFIETLDDDEMSEELVLKVAQKVKQIGAMTILGVKSGDSRKMAKAEKMVDEAIVTMATKANPLLTFVLEQTGFDEELKNHPEMVGYLLQAVSNKGLLSNPDLLSGFAGIDLSSLATPKGSQKTIDTEEI